MALITLKDVGKIYVSDGNVSVGIRGVNLSFDKGEFVAVTGKSGSGKSTLLNVISGMDSYEEGELFIEGQPTSHYLQPEWEEYREKYVSFVFQDYNIIESFTVLQNVELALMHIADKKARRRRALELIDRVGLLAQLRQKGSKLSGGQKQRTVIARALAKESPIILADEPTGNLDSVSSREIIELLREVSRDKLLIVVTHNFEQVEEYATRHIRIFDGAVESDHVLRPAADVPSAHADAIPEKRESRKKAERAKRKKQRRDGITLGRSIFTAKPRLSLFLCLLMIVGTLGIFSVTSTCGEAAVLFEPYYMFEHIDGRLVVAKQSGEVLTEAEIKEISDKYGAKEHVRFDILLDAGSTQGVMLPPTDATANRPKYLDATYTYGKNYGDGIVGRYPEAADEVFLFLPIYLKPIVGEDSLKINGIFAASMSLKLVGVKYYYDNNLTAECLFTDEGFRVATAMHYLSSLENSRQNIYATVSAGDKQTQRVELGAIIPSFDMPADKVYISSRDYANTVKNLSVYGKTEVSVTLEATYAKYDYYSAMGETEKTFRRTFTDAELTDKTPTFTDYFGYDTQSALIISDELLCDIAENVLCESYKQVSFFFEDDGAARAAVDGLRDEGYIAIVSDTTYEPDAFLAIVTVVAGVMMAFMWGITVIFLAFFINLCTGRTLGAFKGDMAIMRSMGIQVKVIRIAMYVRMLLSLIPAFIMVAVMALLIFTTPEFNEYFTYLYAWQYALIFLGMILITVRVTHKQIRKLFGESVKKALKGGAAE